MGWVFLTGTIAFTIFGQLIIKQQLDRAGDVSADGGMVRFLLEFTFTRPLVLAGFAAAFLASMFWIATLTESGRRIRSTTLSPW